MPENGTTDIKVQIGGLKKDIENVNTLNGRLDLAIEKLTDVSTSIKQMLAYTKKKSPDKNKLMKSYLRS